MSFTDKLIHCQRISDSIVEMTHLSGPDSCLNAAGDECLLGSVAAQPDATLAEIGRVLMGTSGPSLQRIAVWQAVKVLDWEHKKASTPASTTPKAS